MVDVKSVSLYKYVTIDTLKHILFDGVRFTQPRAFNDPFELLPELCVAINESEKQITISFDISAKRRPPPVVEVDVNSGDFNCCDIISRNIVRDLNDSIGILCLSKNSDSLLMWAHYAEQYAGAIIEFDGSYEFFDGRIDVDYRPDRPKKDIGVYLREAEPIPLAELCVKSEQWRYEGEVRIIRKLADCEKLGKDNRGFPIYVQKILDNCIKEITLGERTSVENQREIWDRIKESNISLSLAAISNWGYSFRKEKVKFDVPFSKMNPMVSPRTAHIFSHLPDGLGDVARYLIEKHPMSKFVNTTV